MRKIEKQTHYGAETWTHCEMDELRRTECLCRLCAEEDNGFCDNAHALYEVCKRGGIALAVTRCAEFKPKTAEQ